MISGIVTAVLFTAFVAIAIWAWSAPRRNDFERASRLPLEDEPGDRR